jgi:hypothetical protein
MGAPFIDLFALAVKDMLPCTALLVCRVIMDDSIADNAAMCLLRVRSRRRVDLPHLNSFFQALQTRPAALWIFGKR